VGAGAPGFWENAGKIFPGSRHKLKHMVRESSCFAYLVM
jgi:hypothetical protein